MDEMRTGSRRRAAMACWSFRHSNSRCPASFESPEPKRVPLRRFDALLLGFALLAARPAAAGIELAGTTGASFLTLGPGASLVGMGNTGIAGYPDLSAMAWNPASLGLMNESQWMFTHM